MSRLERPVMTPDPAAEPIAYLVAERRGGRWILGDEWVHRCDTLAEARQVADTWRSHGAPDDVAVLAVVIADELAAVAEAQRVRAEAGAELDRRVEDDERGAGGEPR